MIIDGISCFSDLDEDSAIEAHPEEREPYCRAKLLQEILAERYARVKPAKPETQLKPLGFSHARITSVVGWHPRFALSEALARCGGRR
jgi:nucleoside-diphosphate-sugar epimerase